MPATPRHQNHDKYKTRIDQMLKSYTAEDSSPESQAHNAKYLAVLVSGYLEQSIKELLLDYSSKRSSGHVSKYIESSWPRSTNMNVDNIKNILNQFNSTWAEDFSIWIEGDVRRKGDINSIVKWRNNIAHGQEAKTTGVTLVTVKEKFLTVKSLVNFLQSTIII